MLNGIKEPVAVCSVTYPSRIFFGLKNQPRNVHLGTVGIQIIAVIRHIFINLIAVIPVYANA